MDRIDLHVEVTPVSYDKLSSYEKANENSAQIAERVVKARQIQEERQRHLFQCAEAKSNGH